VVFREGGLQLIVDDLTRRGLLRELVGPGAGKDWRRLARIHVKQSRGGSASRRLYERECEQVQQLFGFVRVPLAGGSAGGGGGLGGGGHVGEAGYGPWRRLDVWLYRRPHVPYGLLQCTGSGSFNPSLRKFAKEQRQMHLNQYGLFHRQLLADGTRALVPGADQVTPRPSTRHPSALTLKPRPQPLNPKP